VLGWLSAQGWKLRKTTTTEKSSNEWRVQQNWALW
jgi:hypothetical protein